MSDTPRDQEPGRAGSGGFGTGPDELGIEPVTAPPAGATAVPNPAERIAPRLDAGSGRGATGPGREGGGGAGRAGAQRGGTGRSGSGRSGEGRRGKGLAGWLRMPGRDGNAGSTGPETDPRQRRRRRWLVAGISAGAALVVIALCAGAVGLVSTVSDWRGRNADAREDRRVRDGDCLALEQRLNKLLPPGATTTPQARATAIRNENAAVRIYVGELPDRRVSDGWRQVLDARTAYAEALDVQAKSRTPAFYVAPRNADGRVVTDQLVQWSAPPCAGPIRRLAAPDL